jgi:formyltetrahydrofolate deformylase
MVIVIQCTDKAGLVSAISAIFAKENTRIISMREYRDAVNNLFFLRVESEQCADIQLLEDHLRTILPEDATIHFNPSSDLKVIVLVTKEYHCLADILIRNQFKTLGASVQCVIGNHPTLQNICERFDVPFHYVSHEEKDKPAFESDILQVIKQYKADYLVLAKFMRILSPDFAGHFPNRIINIHHSFLPAFIGANPYRQAFQRGVKLIGATAHFVTRELDEGPIITQQAVPVNNVFTATDMVKAGKEVETAVLAKALQLVFDNRVVVYQNKTVIFE